MSIILMMLSLGQNGAERTYKLVSSPRMIELPQQFHLTLAGGTNNNRKQQPKHSGLSQDALAIDLEAVEADPAQRS